MEPARRLTIETADRSCPLCKSIGEPATFEGLYLCATPGCRVWSYEQEGVPDAKVGYLAKRAK